MGKSIIPFGYIFGGAKIAILERLVKEKDKRIEEKDQIIFDLRDQRARLRTRNTHLESQNEEFKSQHIPKVTKNRNTASQSVKDLKGKQRVVYDAFMLVKPRSIKELSAAIPSMSKSYIKSTRSLMKGKGIDLVFFE